MTVRAVKSQLGHWSDLWGRALGGLGAKNIVCDTLFSFPGSEGNAPFKTNYSKKLLQHSVQGLLKKIVLRNKDIVFCWYCLVHTRSLQSLEVNERLNGRFQERVGEGRRVSWMA